MNRPQRAILNFAHRCAMTCEWCYVPFEESAAREHVVKAIVQRVADLEFKSLTVGGGDPFQYRFLPDILRFAHSLNLFVHVDTHAKGLRQTAENLELLRSSVDLIGLPMDGSSPAVHDLMRSSLVTLT
ncbi:MAG: radical SAM protein [Betaproteobacteria bacterium]|nr:radical SAM protein [Betaproteobacteria bacterium]